MLLWLLNGPLQTDTTEETEPCQAHQILWVELDRRPSAASFHAVWELEA
jgi:hypothetical protein